MSRVPGTWRPPCTSFLIMTCFIIGDCDVLREEGLHRSLQVARLRNIMSQTLVSKDSPKGYFVYILLGSSMFLGPETGLDSKL